MLVRYQMFCAVAMSVATAAAAEAQFTSPPEVPSVPDGFKMVGTPVGGPVVGDDRGFFGTLFGRPAMSPRAGLGNVVDVNNLAAPVAEIPTAQGEGFFRRFFRSLGEVVGLSDSPKPNNTGWFPSLGRRNRQRHEWIDQ